VNNLTVAQIAEHVVDAVPGSKLAITGETGADTRSYRVDFSKARDEIGFTAAWSVADGAAELAKAYTEYGLTQEAFTQRFVRLATLERLRAADVLDESMRRLGAVAR
jgi:hypothetical protein